MTNPRKTVTAVMRLLSQTKEPTMNVSSFLSYQLLNACNEDRAWARRKRTHSKQEGHRLNGTRLSGRVGIRTGRSSFSHI
uniref:Uncharacterized protein n=1 Tax=Utricularia reniformis TaxID=192314 RepID=A0A1Y0AYN8_9LAMI|nr:hypothetical protein AEK19_MT0188 [Utricularia reniformis]ART30261.1 hypothetical protein AEK19_MT0188 [Utricularia reniformis]